MRYVDKTSTVLKQT
ncbi:23S rRNA methyltransferase attenuation leader peptide, partial [Enterococcus faecalis]